MEIFIEHLVKKQKTAKTSLQKASLYFAALLLCIVAFLVCANIQAISFLGIFLVAGIIYGTWYLSKSMNLEFEYILTNGTLDVDKIIAQSRRKRLVSIDLSNIEKMAPMIEKYKSDYTNQGIKKFIDAASGDTKTEYFIKFSNDKFGISLLRFNPDDRIIKGAFHAAPRKVFEA
jgi:hypothetical protein